MKSKCYKCAVFENIYTLFYAVEKSIFSPLPFNYVLKFTL